jgi:hypothetical protein
MALTMDEGAITDWAFPSRGMIRGEALARYVREQTGGQLIEQMKMPLGIVATDLDSGAGVLFRRGDTGTAVRASSSVPVLPWAYSAATRLPAEVPTTRSGRMPASSSTWMTPMWAKPRAAPPPSARPSLGGRFGTGGGGAGGGGGDAGAGAAGGGTVWQPASAARAEAMKTRRNIDAF